MKKLYRFKIVAYEAEIVIDTESPDWENREHKNDDLDLQMYLRAEQLAHDHVQGDIGVDLEMIEEKDL